MTTFGLATLLWMGWCALPHPLFYEQDAIEARVVDKETDAPIEGAAVLAIWYAEKGGMETTTSLYRYEETLTDADGRFRLSGWKRWRDRGEGRLKDEDPVILIYKPGYKSAYLQNLPPHAMSISVQHESGQIETRSAYGSRPPESTPSYAGWPGSKRVAHWHDSLIELAPARTLEEKTRALDIGYDLATENIEAPLVSSVFSEGWRQLPNSSRPHAHAPALSGSRIERR